MPPGGAHWNKATGVLRSLYSRQFKELVSSQLCHIFKFMSGARVGFTEVESEQDSENLEIYQNETLLCFQLKKLI